MGIENFTLLKTLGEGAFASVHKVTRSVDGKTYALKKVDVSSLDDKELVSALNEIRLLASFSHPRIVRLYETFMDGNNLCIVMEYCGWGDLAMKVKRYIKRREYIDERVIWVYLIQILEGLKALHERNVLHRDLKPANCFLAEDGSIKIGDMNVSKVIKDGNARTQIGTPYYMSPEIWARKAYNYATDIWSIGCLIYELCALRPPFLGNNMNELKSAVLGGHFAPIPSVYSTELSTIIARMLQPSPKDRPTALQTLSFPEVQARKCLVKNVLREEDMPSFLLGDDALMPTIQISSLRELALKLPGPCYPTDAPPTPTTPVAEAHDVSPIIPIPHMGDDPSPRARDVSAVGHAHAGGASSPATHERESGSASPTPGSSSEQPTSARRVSMMGGHGRRGSVVPVNVQQQALNYQRRRSVDVPVLPQNGSLPKLGNGVPLEDAETSPRHRGNGDASPKVGASDKSTGATGAGAAVTPGSATPVGEVAGIERKGSVRQVLQAAQSEVQPVRRRSFGQS